jgi:polyhydroxybutyrate depolymerase
LRTLASIAVFFIAPAVCGQPAPGHTTVTLVSSGVERSYRLHVPAGYAGGRVPLVLNFHGSYGAPEDQAALSGFDALADREGFVVAYPQGVFASAESARGWNTSDQDGGVDDVQFVRDVIADVGTKLVVDGNRVYATGFAAGGRMSSRLACELGDVLAAAAPVAGLQYPDGCVPAGAVSIVAFHGKADTVSRYVLTDDSPSDRRTGVEAAAERWRAALECPAGAMEGGFAREPGLVLRVYPPCAGGADFMLYVSESDGHVWPAGASERIWSFFKARPR